MNLQMDKNIKQTTFLTNSFNMWLAFSFIHVYLIFFENVFNIHNLFKKKSFVSS